MVHRYISLITEEYMYFLCDDPVRVADFCAALHRFRATVECRWTAHPSKPCMSWRTPRGNFARLSAFLLGFEEYRPGTSCVGIQCSSVEYACPTLPCLFCGGDTEVHCVGCVRQWRFMNNTCREEVMEDGDAVVVLRPRKRRTLRSALT